MKCGALGVAEAIVKEPEPYDVQFIGCEPVVLIGEIAPWLGAWPRMASVRCGYLAVVSLAQSVVAGSGMRQFRLDGYWFFMRALMIPMPREIQEKTTSANWAPVSASLP